MGQFDESNLTRQIPALSSSICGKKKKKKKRKKRRQPYDPAMGRKMSGGQPGRASYSPPYSARIDSLGPWRQLMRGSTPVRTRPNVFAVKGILFARTVNSMSAPHSWSLGRGAAILYPASPLSIL